MKSHARVVIIGGGVAGASTLYHLAERGWTDCMLLELNELTSGSTWHAAGNIPTFSSSRNVIKLQRYSTELYARLCEDPVYPINYHQTGSLRLAQSRQRMEEFHHVAAMANAMGLEYEILDNAEMKARHPFIEDHELKGALWDPVDGDIDPSQLTQALATHARRAGASIHRFTRVTGLSRTASGEWTVHTDKGDVVAEYVVNAGGYRGAEVTELGGRFLPMVTLEHQYLVTESIPELEALGNLLPLVRDPDDSYYLRQEKSGLILGPYEKEQARARWRDGKIPEDFAYELYADDLERLEWYIERACERMPILGSVGVQRVINGPIPYSPDGMPYVGPAFSLPNFYHVNGFSFGICQGGGAGKSVAEWIIDGKPEWDLWSLDPRRYTDYADQGYVVDRAIELYQHEYAINFPVEERPAGRPRKLSPCYETLKAKGARFGARGGWERATWFADAEDEQDEEPGYQRGKWFDAVGRECLRVQQGVGVLDLCGFTRFELKGEGSTQWLDSMIAGKLPAPGRIALSYFCADDGGVWSEMTVTRLDEEHYWLISAAAARWHDQQWLEEHMPGAYRGPKSAGPALQLRDLSDEFGTLVVAGPRSRDVLQRLTQSDMSNTGFRWLSCQPLQLAGIDVQALRVNYVGELGWELHVPLTQQLALYNALMEAGAEFDIGDFGLYAMESMRLEKSYRAWKVELDHEYSPLRSGLTRFVDLEKPQFKGKSALLAEQARGAPDGFATFVLDEPDTSAENADIIGNTDALYGCPILVGEQVVGYTTSGGYGHRIGKSVALGYIDVEHLEPGTAVTIRVLGESRSAQLVAESPHDPQNALLRA